MSSMLEQAIVDAQALREAALKNAEQSVVEKYAPEIKAAVESLLEGDAKQKVIKEEFEIPYAADPVDKEQEVKMVVEYEFNPEDFKLDLDSLQNAPEQSAEEPAMDMSMETPALPEEAAPVEPTADLEGLLAESDLADDNDLVNEILAILGESDEEEEEEVIDEALTVDVGAEKHGWITTDDATRKYDQELELAKRQSDEYKDKADELTGELEGLKNSLATYQTNQDKLHTAVAEMKDALEEALVSNARLLYTNKVLSDASLNERQKSKIVEVIVKAKTIKEAKSLYETLKEATVGTAKAAPQSLSESVNRRSNLSHVMPRRKQETLTENHSFSERMKKLAGLD